MLSSRRHPEALSSGLLTRYWFAFDVPPPLYHRLPLSWVLVQFGAGVTALDLNDAVAILQEDLFRENQMPPVRVGIVDVDLSTLDFGHFPIGCVTPNWRGTWFPGG